MGVFRYRDRWQQSIRDLWNREDQTDRLMALLEQRDRDLEDWIARGGPAAATSYTPTLGGISLGNGTLSARYSIDLNGYCDMDAVVVLGSTSSVSGRITVALPAAAPAATNSVPRVGAYFEDAATSLYSVIASMDSTTLYLDGVGAAGSYAAQTFTSSTIPFTWGSGDKVVVAVRYLAAV